MRVHMCACTRAHAGRSRATWASASPPSSSSSSRSRLARARSASAAPLSSAPASACMSTPPGRVLARDAHGACNPHAAPAPREPDATPGASCVAIGFPASVQVHAGGVHPRLAYVPSIGPCGIRPLACVCARAWHPFLEAIAKCDCEQVQSGTSGTARLRRSATRLCRNLCRTLKVGLACSCLLWALRGGGLLRRTQNQSPCCADQIYLSRSSPRIRVRNWRGSTGSIGIAQARMCFCRPFTRTFRRRVCLCGLCRS